MGSMKLAYPSLAGKTADERVESLRRYLCTLTDQLNLADWSANAVLREVSQAIDADSMTEDRRQTLLSGYASLKALIIKTADYAAANSEEFQTKLSGNYVAVSDFGTYWEKATMTVNGNEFGIRQLYDPGTDTLMEAVLFCMITESWLGKLDRTEGTHDVIIDFIGCIEHFTSVR